MVRTAKRPFLIALACLAAPPVAGAERIAVAAFAAERPAADRVIALALRQGRAASRLPVSHKGTPAHGPFEMVNSSRGARRDRTALRIDLFRRQVTRPAAGPPGAFPPGVFRIRLKRGATPNSKAVGIGMAVAPNVVVESRVGPGGETDTGVRFRLLY